MKYKKVYLTDENDFKNNDIHGIKLQYKEKKCITCDGLFYPVSARQKECKRKHLVNCSVCNKLFNISERYSIAFRETLTKVFCSNNCTNKYKSAIIQDITNRESKKECKKCKKIFMGRTFLKICKDCSKIHCKHCNNIFVPIGKELYCSKICKKKEQTIIRKNIIKKRVENGGISSPFCKKEVREKAQKTIKDTYGVNNVFQSEQIKNKIKETNKKKYGVENPSQSKVFIDKIKNTKLEKYGDENYNNIKKAKNTFIEKYGVNHPSQIHIDDFENYMNVDFFLEKGSILKLQEHFNLPRYSIRNQVKTLKIEDKFTDFYIQSESEEKLNVFLKNLNVNYVRNTRNIIAPYSLDFYFPDHNFAIELSPSSTHNSLWGIHNGEPKTKTYHQNKFKMCEKKGVELMTVFDWHDWNKSLEMIKSKINFNSKIYARKCTYEETTLNKNLRKLFNNWHILNLPHNIPNGPVSILKYNDEIVGVALWKHNKKTIELKRLVFKPDFTIQGGASKLIKNYMKNNNINEIITYSDNDLGVGNVYKTLGFKLIEESQPGLNFYHPYYEKHIKNLSLVMQGADRLLKDFPKYIPVGLETEETGPLPTNQEIVQQYGFLPIYDCGYKKWKLKIK